jgi:hypothetical protein
MESKCINCGCQEFVTQPNSYDIYKVVNGKLEFQESELIDNKFILYCRECGKRYKEKNDKPKKNNKKFKNNINKKSEEQ